MLRQKRNNFLIVLCPIEIISLLLMLYHRHSKICSDNVRVSCVEEWFVEGKVLLLVRHILKKREEKPPQTSIQANQFFLNIK